MSLRLTSRAFQNEGTIPEKYSKMGGNISPQLSWTGLPEGTRSLVLIVDDPDAPGGEFVHWLVYGIPPDATELPEHLPRSAARQGLNGFGELGYGGPQPPSGTHHYVFHLYALDTDSTLPPGMDRQELDGDIEGHVIEEARLTGRYQHHSRAHATH